MPARKPPPPYDDPEQSRRFIDMAREVGADDEAGREDVFSEVVRKLGTTPKEQPSKKGKPPKAG